MGIFSRMLNTLPKRLFAGTLFALSVALPVAASAAQTVSISATTGVANVTNGDTNYSSSVNAAYNQIVKVEIDYTNDEPAGSNLVANNVTMQITLPTTSGTSQTVTSTVSGSNTNTVNGSAVVNLAQTGYLQYVPGSAQIRVTEPDGTVTPVTTISDGIITGSGYVINNGNPCQSAAVAVEAQVMVPGVTVTKQVADDSSSNPTWATSDIANPGDTLKYMITYSNEGNTDEQQVVIRDQLPAGLTLVPNSTYLTDSVHPNGLLNNDANGTVTTIGIDAGEFNPGQVAYITLKATVPAAAKLACGANQFSNVGYVAPQGMGTYSAIATTTVNNTCTTPTPTYACDYVDVTVGDHSATISDLHQSTTNGATYTGTAINWGDGTTTPTTIDVVGQPHNYSGNGPFTITATASFTVNGKDVTATSGGCAKQVSFTTPTTPTTPTTLVNTGPGDVIGIVGLATVLGVLGHNLFMRRSISRIN
jgi:uncharacterized repeat protein (TIGR01451 family)